MALDSWYNIVKQFDLCVHLGLDEWENTNIRLSPVPGPPPQLSQSQGQTFGRSQPCACGPIIKHLSSTTSIGHGM